MAENGAIYLFGTPVGLDYLVYLALGVLVICWFAFNLLNRPILVEDEDEKTLYELVGMRNFSLSGEFLRSYIVFVSILLVIYFTASFCAAVVGKSPLFSADVAGYAIGDTLVSGEDVKWPLAFALAIVGLGPTLPVLGEVVESLRRIAHQLVGIPRNIIQIADMLRRCEIDERDLREGERRESDVARNIAEKLQATDVELPESVEVLFQKIRLALLARHWLFVGPTSQHFPDFATRSRFAAYKRYVDNDTRSFYLLCHRLAATTDPIDADDVRELQVLAEHAGKILSLYLALCAVHSAPPPAEAKSKALATSIQEVRKSGGRQALDATLASVAIIVLFVLVVTYLSAALGFIAPVPSTTVGPEFLAALIYASGALSIYLPAAAVGWLVRSARLAKGRWQPRHPRQIRFRQFLRLGIAAYLASASFFFIHAFIVRTVRSFEPSGAYNELLTWNGMTPILWWPLLGAALAIVQCRRVEWIEERATTRTPIGLDDMLASCGSQALVFAVISAVCLSAPSGAPDFWLSFNWYFSMTIGFLFGLVQIYFYAVVNEGVVVELHTAPPALRRLFGLGGSSGS